MKNYEIPPDDLLKDLIFKSSPESPPDDFVSKVMSRIDSLPEYVPLKKSFIPLLKSMVMWAFLGLVVCIFIFSSDLSFLNDLPGITYMQHILSSAFESFITPFKSVFAGRFGSLVLIVLISGSVLFAIERLIGRKTSLHRQYLV